MMAVKMESKDKMFKVCIRCGSTNWYYDTVGISGTAASATNLIECRDCHYRAMPVEVNKETQEEMKKNFREQK